jgi:two-component system OmpR family sensor kinase
VKWHVFPNGPLCSIRRALMLWLLPLFLAVGALGAVVSYWSFSHMVSTFMDEQMQQLAIALSDNRELRPAPQNAERVYKWGAYVVQTYDAGGTLHVSSWPQLQLPLQSGAGFHDVRHDGRAWRVFTLPAATAGDHSVQVLQSDGFRAKLAAERAGAAVLPILLLIPLVRGPGDVARAARHRPAGRAAGRAHDRRAARQQRAGRDRPAGPVVQRPAAPFARRLRHAAPLRAGRGA